MEQCAIYSSFFRKIIQKVSLTNQSHLLEFCLLTNITQREDDNEDDNDDDNNETNSDSDDSDSPPKTIIKIKRVLTFQSKNHHTQHSHNSSKNLPVTASTSSTSFSTSRRRSERESRLDRGTTNEVSIPGV